MIILHLHHDQASGHSLDHDDILDLESHPDPCEQTIFRPQPNEIDVLLIYSVLHCFLSSPCYTLYCTLAASEIVLVTR